MKRDEKLLLSRDKGDLRTDYVIVRIRSGRHMVKFDGRTCMEQPLVVTAAGLPRS